jgi:hypothetical protein
MQFEYQSCRDTIISTIGVKNRSNMSSFLMQFSIGWKKSPKFGRCWLGDHQKLAAPLPRKVEAICDAGTNAGKRLAVHHGAGPLDTGEYLQEAQSPI